MTPLLVGVQTGERTYQIAARPDGGIPAVTLYVVPVIMPGKGWRYHVKRNPQSPGYVTSHTTFEAAVMAATRRAKRYVQLASKTLGRRVVSV